VERGLSSHHLTALQAEILLIRLRQANHDYRHSTEEERAETVSRWKEITGHGGAGS